VRGGRTADHQLAVARDRQAAKRRQAERREARLRERRGARPDGDGGTSAPPREEAGRPPDDAAAAPPREPMEPGTPDARREPPPTDGAAVDRTLPVDPSAGPRLAASAPPETAGRSDTVVDAPPPAPELEVEDQAAARRGRDRGEGKERGRVVAFLVAVWAELKRVQWPDRKTLTTLTGVVLGFVLIAGGYLGALDAIFSRLIQAIL
jgi:preprotein translocase SecE subunit